MPTQSEIEAFLAEMMKTTDVSTITLKVVKGKLKEELNAEAGTHYEKDWLKGHVARLVQASAPADDAAAAAEAPPVDDTAPPVADAADEEAAPNADAEMPEAAAPVEAAEADEPAKPAYPVGTVLWAKMRGYPYWPSMVWPQKQSKQSKYLSAGGWHFVRFFGTNQFGYIDLLQPWEGYLDKGEKDAKKATKGKVQLGKDFKKAMEEAASEIGSPTPMADLVPDGAGGEEEEEAEGEEEEEEEKPKKKPKKEKKEKPKKESQPKAAALAADSSDEEGATKPVAKAAAKGKSKGKAKPAADSSDEEGGGGADGEAAADGEEAEAEDEEAAAAKAAAKAERKVAKKAAKKAAKEAARAAKAEEGGADGTASDDNASEIEEAESDEQADDANDDDFAGGDDDDDDDGDGDGEEEEGGGGLLTKPKRASGKRKPKGEGGGAPRAGTKKAAAAERAAARAASGEPKRPTNAYMTFAGEVRETVKEANPGASMGELSKLLGEKWKGMSDEEKLPYTSKADAAKAAYDEAMVEFRKANPSAKPAPKPRAPRAAGGGGGGGGAGPSAAAKALAGVLEEMADARETKVGLEAKVAENRKMIDRCARKRAKLDPGAEGAAEMRAKMDTFEENAQAELTEQLAALEAAKGAVARLVVKHDELTAAEKAADDEKKAKAEVKRKEREAEKAKAKAEALPPEDTSAADAEAAAAAKAAKKAKKKADAESAYAAFGASLLGDELAKEDKAEKRKRSEPVEAAAPSPTKRAVKRVKMDDDDDDDDDDGAAPVEAMDDAEPVDTAALSAQASECASKLMASLDSGGDDAAVDAALTALEGMKMTLDILGSSGVGKACNKLRKASDASAAVQARAKALVEKWKALASA